MQALTKFISLIRENPFTSGVIILNVVAVGVAVTMTQIHHRDYFDEDSWITTLSTLQLFLIGVLAFRVFKLRVKSERGSLLRRQGLIWGLIGLGFCYLALDEKLKIHEKIDYEIHEIFNWEETGLTDRIDDFVIVFYLIMAAGVLALYVNELKAFRKVWPLAAAAFCLIGLMVVFDAITNRYDILLFFFEASAAEKISRIMYCIEDSSKMFAEVLLIVAFYSVMQISRKQEISTTPHHDKNEKHSKSLVA